MAHEVQPYKSKQLAPLRGVDPKAILELYLSEKTSTEIAAMYGVTRAAVSQYMLNHAEKEWKDAQVVKALVAKDDAEKLLATAQNSLDLARGREQLRAAQWDLERVCRRIYGQDQPPTNVNALQININLRRDGVATEQREIQAIDSQEEKG